LRVSTSLPAIGIASVIALAGLTAGPSPVAATDPIPTPTPTATEIPTPTPSSSPEASASPAPEPSSTADPTASPSPTESPDPTASPAPVEPGTTVSTTTTTMAPTWAQLVGARYLRAARVAVRQRHDRYVPGGTGPSAFDCSGLVRFAYRQAGIGARLGGGHSARAMLAWARRHGKIRRHHGHVGDVVIWGNGRHAGIYLGHGRAISALNPRQDIRITGIHALGDAFTAFISTRP
jgi:cell wall-associated NlpC family hydrolase